MSGKPLAPMDLGDFTDLIGQQPGFTKITDEDLQLSMQDSDKDDPITITIKVDTISPAIDSSSSSMKPEDWTKITHRLLSNYSGFSGQVVLHGTDTMAFTGSTCESVTLSRVLDLLIGWI